MLLLLLALQAAPAPAADAVPPAATVTGTDSIPRISLS